MNDYKFNGNRMNVTVDSLVYVTSDYSNFCCNNNVSRHYKKTLNSLRKYGNPNKRTVKVYLKDNLLIVNSSDVDLFIGLVELGLLIYFTIVSDISINVNVRELEKENRMYE